jgi:predicted XRE-type DNA-binding protein
VEGLLIRRFPEIPVEEIRKMFHLTDIRKSLAFKEAYELACKEVRKDVREEVRKDVRKDVREEVNEATLKKLLARGMSQKEVAEVLNIPLSEARRLAKKIHS